MLRSCYRGVVGVYQIRCVHNDKSYIGASLNVGLRLGHHISELSKRIHRNIDLQTDYDKWDKQGFEVKLLASLPDRDRFELLRIEIQLWEQLYPNVYNKQKPHLIGCPEIRYKNIPEMTPDQAYQFWKQVEVKGHNDCWEWKGRRQKKGYGAFRMQNDNMHTWISSRVAYWLYHGRQPGKLQVTHKCDNPPCVNPKHLVLGTPLDNARDMIDKSRIPLKFTPGIAKSIRSMYFNQGFTSRKIKSIFGCGDIYRILDNSVKSYFDPAYQRPIPKIKQNSYILTIYGESKSRRSWSIDPRCSVSDDTLKKRMLEGWPENPEILESVKRKSIDLTWYDEARINLIRYWDSKGLAAMDINKKLRIGNLKTTSDRAVADLNTDYVITAAQRTIWESLPRNCGVARTASETGIPCSVVRRYYGEIGNV